MAENMTWSSLHLQCEAEIGPKLNELLVVWQEIGVTGESLSQRQHIVVGHINNIVDEMLLEERAVKDRLTKSVLDSEHEIEQLSLELKVMLSKDYNTDMKDLGLIHREKYLRDLLTELRIKKTKRLSIYKELCQREKLLCSSLGFATNSESIGIPTDEDIQKLTDHVDSLQREKEKRMLVFNSTKHEIVKLMSEVGMEPSDDFEQDVVCEDAETFHLSSGRIRLLSTLLQDVKHRKEKMVQQRDVLREQIVSVWDRLRIEDTERYACEAMTSEQVTQQSLNSLQDELDRCHNLLKHNLNKLVNEVRQELKTYWNRCYVSQEQRAKFTVHFTADASEEVLVLHDKELCQLRDWYHANQAVYHKVVQWLAYWQEYLDLERLSNDPSRRYNRGGVLLRDDAQRKKLLKELPTLQKEIHDETSSWCEMAIHINGQPFVNYVQQQFEEHENQKEQEKIRRQQEKSNNLKIEMKFGSRPVEANKKRLAAQSTTSDITSIPSKQRRINDATGKPSTPHVPRVLTSTMNISAVPSVRNLALRRRSNRLNASRMCKVSTETSPSSSAAHSKSTSRFTCTPRAPQQPKTTPYSLRQPSTAQIILRQFPSTPLTPKRASATPLSLRQTPTTRLRSQSSKSSPSISQSRSSFKWNLPTDKPVFHLVL